jgi:hypothetical protein
LEERQSRELAKTYAEKLTLRKGNFARANQLNPKSLNQTCQNFAEKIEADFRDLT